MLKMIKPLRYPKISITIYKDASLEGWGENVGKSPLFFPTNFS